MLRSCFLTALFLYTVPQLNFIHVKKEIFKKAHGLYRSLRENLLFHIAFQHRKGSEVYKELRV